MKRTFKFCALLFCAMLWLNPVGAQQKAMPVADNNGTELKMDKVPLMMQRQKAMSVNKMLSAETDARLIKLSEEQKEEMVRSYMQAAFSSKMAKAPKAGGIGPKTFIGGAYLSYDLYEMGFTARFTINEDGEPSLVEDMESPIYNTSQGLSGFPLDGTWNGQYFEGNWAAMYSSSGEIAGFFGYYIYDPASNRVQKLCETSQTGLSAYNSCIAYDYSTKKNFAIRRYEHKTEEGEWVCDSNLVFQAAPNTGAYTRVAKLSGVTESVVAMAITKEGAMYAIALDGNLYSINTSTWAATEMGSTGIELADMGCPQAMAADYRSGKLYWNYVDTEENMAIAEVNATTGEITSDEMFENILTCMTSLYYVANNPQSIADFALSYANTKVKANFTIPTLTVNGDDLSQLDTVEIFKVVNGSLAGRVWAQQNPVLGTKMSQELENLGANGETVTLAIRVKDKNGNYSSFETASVLLFDVTLPYVNGFETDAVDPMAAIVVIDPQNKGGMGRTTDEHHTGNYSFKMSGLYAARDVRQVNIQGMPVKKGGVYSVTLWAKTNATAADGILFAFDGADFTQYFSVTSEWKQWGTTYEATATGQMSLTLQPYGAIAQDINAEYFIDDIEVKELVSPDVPAPFTFNSVTAAPKGALQAVANITLPSVTMAEETLSKIDSIVFQVASSYMFLGTITQTTVKENLTPGATTNVSLDVPKAGTYYIRAIIYNENGSCPYYSQYLNAAGTNYQATPWIGSDLPASVKVTATPGTDGTVALSWVAPTATHQGYIGTDISYKLTDAAGTELYNGSNLSFTTSALALGMHTFTLEFSDDAASKSFNFNTLAGIQEGMVYSNVATAGTTNARVLNVSAESANSAFAQMLYPATNQAMYIDTLLLFATAPTEGEAKQYTKIYMGITDLTAFGGSMLEPDKDFVEKAQLTEVFADTLRFKAGQNTLKLPLKGFYYNGTQSLVINVVKPMQEATTFAAAAYVASAETNMFKYRSTTSTSIDFDTVTSYNESTGYPAKYSVSMVATPGVELKTIKVMVDSMGVTPLQDAIITIVNKGGKNMNATLTTAADGTVTFAYMPVGTYLVKAQKAAYISSEQEVTIAETSPVEVTFSLIKAKELKVSGTVEDKGGNALAGVTVKAAGLADFTATTDDNGAFELQNVYGPGEYTLSFEKAGMRTLSMPFVLGEQDTTLAKVEMAYTIVDVPMASVAVEEGQAVVNWSKPSVSTMVTWTPEFTQYRRLTLDNKTAFKYAQRFLPEDLSALKLGNDTRALRFGFVPGSEVATYSIVVASDTTHEIYRAEVPADKLNKGVWCDIDIPSENAAAIDVTKELWLIVEVSGTDQDYPCAATTTGTLSNKGNLIYRGNRWYQIADLFTSAPGNVLVRLLVEDASTQIEAANGYRVYRGKLQDEFKDYTLLTETTVKTTTYTDATYAAQSFGQYKYAVVSDWYGEDLSTPTYTNTLNKDMEFTVTFKVTSNAGSAKDADVYMINVARTRTYEALVNDKDTASIAKVWRDVYDYEISLPYHQSVVGKLGLVSDTVITVALQETVLNPELTAEVEGKDIVVNYGVNLHNWFDDVESYEDFAIENIGDYILSEPVSKGGIKDVSWTNMGEEQSWIVFNPSKTKPAMNLPAHSGDKMFAAFYQAFPQGVEAEDNDDYLIRPVSKGGGTFIFYCRAYSNQMPEAFEVVYSSTTADLSAFKTVQAYTNVTVTSWTPVALEIPEDAKYVGIHCTSYDAFIFLVDDLAYYTEDPANPTKYELYLDGTKVNEAKVDELTYTFKNVEFGEHKVGVKAIYASGASEMVEKTVKVSAEAKPVNLNVEVEERTAVLTWEMPEGFAPTSYKVFLGGELKAENLTEKTYTFSDLKNGNYTADVVAVYETGESEKATIEFEIKSNVDVEDFDMAVRSKVYPNPNNGMFYLQAADKGLVEVYAMNGQLVKRVEIPAQGTYSINLQNRTKGMYLLKFATRENTSLFKLVIR